MQVSWWSEALEISPSWGRVNKIASRVQVCLESKVKILSRELVVYFVIGPFEPIWHIWTDLQIVFNIISYYFLHTIRILLDICLNMSIKLWRERQMFHFLRRLSVIKIHKQGFKTFFTAAAKFVQMASMVICDRRCCSFPVVGSTILNHGGYEILGI